MVETRGEAMKYTSTQKPVWTLDEVRRAAETATDQVEASALRSLVRLMELSGFDSTEKVYLGQEETELLYLSPALTEVNITFPTSDKPSVNPLDDEDDDHGFDDLDKIY